MKDVSSYLGSGFGLGVVLDEKGLLQSLTFNQSTFRVWEESLESYRLVHKPSFEEKHFVIEPGRISPPHKLVYRFEGQGSDREIEINPDDNTVQLRYSRVTSASRFALSGWRSARGTGAGLHVEADDAGGIAEVSIHFSRKGCEESERPMDGAAYRIADGLTMTIGLRPESTFVGTVVIAGSVEMAAIVCSVLHDPGLYLPVIFIENRGVTAEEQLHLDALFQLTRPEAFVFAGVSKDAVEDLLWDRSTSFRERCHVFCDEADVSAVPDYAELPVLRCARTQLALGLLVARRKHMRLALDDAAELPPDIGSIHRKDLVTFEGIGPAAIIAANFAFFRDADLVDVGEIPSEVSGSVWDHIRRIQKLCFERREDLEVHTLATLIRQAVRLQVEGYETLTAFTHALPYSVAYSDLPVGHVLDEHAARDMIVELARSFGACPPVPIALLASSIDFPNSEVATKLRDVSGDFFCIVREAATKFGLLLDMQVLPLGSAGIETPMPPEMRIGRDRVRTSDQIDGIMMSDALITPEDIHAAFRAPLRWGVVINNGCATWTSLAAVFRELGALGYVGTLWPVEAQVALDVGEALLTSRGAVPFVQTVHTVTAKLGVEHGSNYVCMGSPFSKIGGRLNFLKSSETAQQIWLAIAWAEGLFQDVLLRADESLLKAYAQHIETTRLVLHELARNSCPEMEAYLWLWRAQSEQILEERQGCRGNAERLYRKALATIDQFLTSVRNDKSDLAGTAEEFYRDGRCEILLSLARYWLGFQRLSEASEVLTELRDAMDSRIAARIRLGVRAVEFELARLQGNWGAMRSALANLRVLAADDDSALKETTIDIIEKGLNDPVGSQISEASQRTLETLGSDTGVTRISVADFFFGLGERCRNIGRLGEALAHYHRCVELYTALHQNTKIAATLNNMGILFRIDGDNATARRYFERAYLIKRRLGSADIGNTLLHLGDLSQNEPDPEVAEDFYSQAADAFQRSRNSKGIAELCLQRGRWLARRGLLDESDRTLLRGLAEAVALQAPTLVAQLRVQLAIVRLRQGKGEALAELVEGDQTLARARVPIDGVQESDLIVGFIRALRETTEGPSEPNVDAVRQLVGEEGLCVIVRDVFDSCLARGGFRAAHNLLVRFSDAIDDDRRRTLLIALGRQDEVAKSLLDELGSLQPSEDRLAHANKISSIANQFKRSGEWQRAVELLERARFILRGAGAEDKSIDVEVDLASALLEGSNLTQDPNLREALHERARNLYEDALRTLEVRPGTERRRGHVLNNLGYLHHERGHPDDAIVCYEQSILLLKGGEDKDDGLILAHENLGELCATVPDQLGRARAAFQSVRELTNDIGRATTTDIHRWRLGATWNLAALAVANGEWTEGLELFSEAFSLLHAQQAGNADRMCTYFVDVCGDFEQKTSEPARSALRAAMRHAQAGEPSRVAECLSCATACLRQQNEKILDLVYPLTIIEEHGLALLLCNTILGAHPEHYRAHLVRGRHYSAMKEYGLASVDFAWCRHRQPEDPRPWNNEGWDCFAQRLFEKAIQFADQAIALADRCAPKFDVPSQYSHPWQLKALASCLIPRPEEAAQALDKLLCLNPEPADAKVYQTLLISLRMGDFRAIAEMIKAREEGSSRGNSGGPEDV